MADADSTAPDRTTVLGAAQYIATLKDGPEPSDTQPPEAKPTDAPRADTAKGAADGNGNDDADDAKAPDADDDAGPKPDDADADEKSDADDAGDQEPQKPELKDDDVVFTLSVEGKEIPVTRAEAKRGHLRQEDYTRKTQQVAEQRRAVEAKEQEVAATLADYAQRLKQMDEVLQRAEVKEPNWDEVRQTDPEGFADRVAEWQVTKSKLDRFNAEKEQVRRELEKKQAAALHQVVEREARLLVEARPELADPAAYQKFGETLMAVGESQGFSRDEVAGTVDHRLLLLLDKAAKYDAVTKELDTLKRAAKEAPKGPKTLPAGGAQRRDDAGDKTKKEALARVRNTGRFDDGVAAIRALG